MAQEGASKPKKQTRRDEKLTDDEDFKKAYPKQAGKIEKPVDPPPEPRSTDPRRKQR